MPDILASHLAAALAQPLRISANVQAEARENLFYLGLTEAKLALLAAPAVEEWLEKVLAGKQRQLQEQRGSHYPMQFYCWHDAQASQLRFSLVAAAATLPFSCALRLAELSVVIEEFLTQKYLVFGETLFDPEEIASRSSANEVAAEKYVLSIRRSILP